jgi:hypothetical protein
MSNTEMTITLASVALAAIAVLFVPAARTEFRNTRPRVTARVQPRLITIHDVIPDDVPIPRPAAAGVAKRYVPAGRGPLTRTRTGPLAWIWEPLDPQQYPLRRVAGPQAVATMGGAW